MKIVVFCYDKYSWLMPTFLHFFKKNWPDNLYQIEFVTEIRKVEGMSTFCTGKLLWADRAIKYLEFLNEEKFLLLLDDYILNKIVDTDRIKRAENLCIDDIGCIRLTIHEDTPRYKLNHFLVDTDIEGFKEYPLDKPYSISLQASIWQKDFFLEFLQKGETIWQTEVNGSKRIQKSNKRVIWTDTPIISYHPCGYMKKGRIVESVSKWVKENW